MRVTPIRFTNDVPAMRRFLEALGLRPYVTSDGGGCVDLRGGAGRVHVHTTTATEVPRRAGETGLSFEADEPLEDVMRRPHAAGLTRAR
jgi:hypothetical protein